MHRNHFRWGAIDIDEHPHQILALVSPHHNSGLQNDSAGPNVNSLLW